MDQNVEMLLLNKINKQVDIVSGVHRERERAEVPLGSKWILRLMSTPGCPKIMMN